MDQIGPAAELDEVLVEVDGKLEHLHLGLITVDFLAVTLRFGCYPNDKSILCHQNKNQSLTETAKVFTGVDSALSTSIT